MSQAYTIPYKLTDDVTFPTKKGMQKHLEHELNEWSDFLTAFEEGSYITRFEITRSIQVDQHTIAQSLQRLIDLLETPEAFNNSARKTRYHSQATFPAPPSTSFAGRLILGLFKIGETASSVRVFLWSVFGGDISGVAVPTNLNVMIGYGRQLFDAAKVVQALPLHEVSHQKLSAAARTAEAQVESLKEEIKSAQALNAEHDKNLSEKLEEFRKDYKATEDDILSQQDALLAEHKAQIDELNADLEAQSKKYERQLAAYNVKTVTFENERKANEEDRTQSFNELYALFHEQLKFKAPVELWGALSESHRKKAFWALLSFIALTSAAIATGVAVPYFFGDHISDSFFTEICLPSGAENCVTSREFSARGPLTISGILAATTLVFWLIRLQFKVFLSERHLSLDAAEKKAFAQTYLAMKEGKDINRDSEAIVLAALFRPTQDGIIKDDEASLDISAAAILAKQLSR